jgi:hypothetical protein
VKPLPQLLREGQLTLRGDSGLVGQKAFLLTLCKEKPIKTLPSENIL